MEPRTFQERRRQPSADVAAGGWTVLNYGVLYCGYDHQGSVKATSRAPRSSLEGHIRGRAAR